MVERTMEELLCAPTEGYGEAIVLPEINADHFEIKTNLLQLVQANPFNGRENENPHAHINSFKRITSTLRFRNVPNDVIKLMMFPYSLEGAAKTWYEKEPPNSILTWEDLVTKFQQRFDESFYEAWDRFNDLLRACPHHGFSELHQLDTFYNALNANDQDSLNSAAGGNFLDKMPRECLKIIESKSKVRNSRNKAVVAKVSSNSSTPGISPDVAALTTEVSELKNMMKTMLIDKQKAQAPVPVKAVEQSCVTCGGAHSYRNCPATDGNIYRDNIQEFTSSTYQAPTQQMQGVSKTDFENYVKANDVVLRNMQNQGQGSLPSNTVTNPKEDLKGITTRSGVAYKGPTIPITSFLKVMNVRTEVTKDTIFPNNNGITEDVQPPVVPVENQNPVSEPVDAPVSAPMPNQKPSIPYPSRRNDEKRRENADEQKEKFYEIFKDMSFEISFMDALTLMPKFASTLKALIGNKEKLSEMARTPLNEHCSAVILNKLPEKLGDPDRFLIPCKFLGMDECLVSDLAQHK
ncbi:hypothetical protein Tco_1071522 [Tanacetum coccineum]